MSLVLRDSDGRDPGARPRSRAPRNGAAPAPPRPVSWRSAKTIRWSKVMTAQARIAVGYYDREDVKELLLDAVMQELDRH